MCSGRLVVPVDQSALACEMCGRSYPVSNDVLLLLPEYDDDQAQRYAKAYEAIAHDDLATPFEHDRKSRHDILVDFIGNVDGQRILDIGSSNAAYLARLQARSKVALDIAFPYLDAVEDDRILRVCGDAETLPFRKGVFDVVVISDVLEHLLHPERLVARLHDTCTPETRIIVHVPWKEDIAKYADSPYEFTHLRTFDDYTFALLWRGFTISRRRATYPSLEQPVPFQLARFLPLSVYSKTVELYFQNFANVSIREYTWRARRIEQLPRGERLLLLLYPPKFKMFELRLSSMVRMRQIVGRVRRLATNKTATDKETQTL
jgi:SAM-dependent methyltransferase